MSSKRNVLAVAAHFDDAELGCGGTLALHAKRGDKVTLFVATSSDYADLDEKTVRSAAVAAREGRKAARILGADLIEGPYKTFAVRYDDDLIVSIRKIVERRGIDTVYLPFAGDVHQDHRAVARAALTAARHCPRILMYKINYYESEDPFVPRHFVDISSTMKRKLKALEAHASEMKRTGGKWLEYTTQADRNRGISLGTRYAEAFQTVRYLEP